MFGVSLDFSLSVLDNLSDFLTFLSNGGSFFSSNVSEFFVGRVHELFSLEYTFVDIGITFR